MLFKLYIKHGEQLFFFIYEQSKLYSIAQLERLCFIIKIILNTHMKSKNIQVKK